MSPISTKELDLYKKEHLDTFSEGLMMPLSVHLSELRSKILISLLTLTISVLIGFVLSKTIVSLLIATAPKETIFIQIKPGEFFFTCIRISTYFGIALSSPIILWQLASFIMPGLKEKERKVTIPIVCASPILFATGVIFAYYFVVPAAINFLFGFGEKVIQTSISIENFACFTLMIMAICGFTFLLPVAIIILANLGIVNSSLLLTKWRYMILFSVTLGAILTPTPDPFNMGIVSLILICLYFFSVGILKVLRK